MRIDTLYVALVSLVRAATTKGDSDLRICPYNEGVGTVQNQMPLHVVGCSLPPFGRLMAMGSCYKLQYTEITIKSITFNLLVNITTSIKIIRHK